MELDGVGASGAGRVVAELDGVVAAPGVAGLGGMTLVAVDQKCAREVDWLVEGACLADLGPPLVIDEGERVDHVHAAVVLDERLDVGALELHRVGASESRRAEPQRQSKDDRSPHGRLPDPVETHRRRLCPIQGGPLERRRPARGLRREWPTGLGRPLEGRLGE